MLGAFGEQHIEPILIVCQRDAADVMQPARHSGDLFKLSVELDRIALKRRHVGVAVESMEPSGSMPCRTRCQFRPLEKHDIGPPQFRQMVKNGCADDASTNDSYSGAGLHCGSCIRVFVHLCSFVPELAFSKTTFDAALQPISGWSLAGEFVTGLLNKSFARTMGAHP